MECRWLLIVCLTLLLQLSFEATSEQSSDGKNVKRQAKRKNNIGFFGLLRNFVRDTITDTNFVIRNITDIVSEEFPPPNAQQDVVLSFAIIIIFPIFIYSFVDKLIRSSFVDAKTNRALAGCKNLSSHCISASSF